MDLIEILGDDGDVIDNPYLGLWADKLQGWLDRARKPKALRETNESSAALVFS